MIVIYAEKADMANKIAAALGGFDLPGGTHITFKNRTANKKTIERFQNAQGYLDTTWHGEKCKVTWGFGHLYALQDVFEYEPTYKTWKNRPTCFIPEKFILHETTNPNAGFQRILDKQRKKAKELFPKASYVINTTDYDREGELIFGYVCEGIGYNKPFKRALFTSQTEEGIREAFDNLLPSSAVQNIEYAGRARSIYDWLIGMNLTTQMTLRFPGNGVLSIGRVQTPVLKMIVDREEAINSFIPKVPWNVNGVFKVGTETYNGLCKGNGDMTKTEVDGILAAIAGHQGTVSKLEKKKQTKEVPLLYSQTSLQIDANKYFGYTAQQTLDATQFLYENGFTTYPRTKSQYLTDDMEPVVIKTLKSLATVPEYQKFIDGMAISPAKKFFDSAKVISHFAIIPTGEIPKTLTTEQKNIYDLIVWSLIRTIYPAAIIEKTTVVTTVDGKYDFSTSGSVVVSLGWMSVNVKTKDTFLPPITLGAMYDGEYTGKESKTSPPERYDDGSLLRAMKTAGKDLDDATFRAILADPNVEGIGTDATRAGIIEMLIRRKYVVRQGKKFAPTDTGINLIHNIPVPDMMSAEFTARMEQNLSKIENGELAYNDFLTMISKQVDEWCKVVAGCKGVGTFSVKAASPAIGTITPVMSTMPPTIPGMKRTSKSSATKSPATKTSKSRMKKCPVCGSELVENTKAWNCTSNKCDFHIFKTMLSHNITTKEVQELLSKGKTKPINDFVSKKTGKTFTASLVLNADHSIGFDFAAKQ